MQIVNAELVRRALEKPEATVKFIINDAAVVFFSATQQHRDVKTHGLSYEDNYRGNAAAGLLGVGRVEIRFHAHYSASHIRTLWSRVQAMPELIGLELGNLYYRGQEIR